MPRPLSLVLALVSGCAGNAPSAEPSVASTEPPTPVIAEEPSNPNPPVEQPQPTRPTPAGRRVWELLPNAPHGRCCKINEECEPITCEIYAHGHPSCERVCTYACEPGDLCPSTGGAMMPPPPCPEYGFCPVGRPNV